jgi:hypothetical protein
LRSRLATELARIAGALGTQSVLRLKALHAEPSRYADGMIVYADGSDWDPGSGGGFYGREGGAWVKL